MENNFGKRLAITETPIAGLLLVDLPVHGDNRGWFKENWQRAAMTAVGLPDFGPVQHNISFNERVGTTRGIHAEPWDKFVSIAAGRIFGAWVDLRPGRNFGTVFTAELDPTRAVYIPRGVGNAFQTLEERTVYSYLVNDHWNAQSQSRYSYVNLADDSLGIAWPVPLDRAVVSDKDRKHPPLPGVTPMAAKKTLVLGAGGQLGMALRTAYATRSNIVYAGRKDFDLTVQSSELDWSDFDTIINAAAYTRVDEAETSDGRRLAWSTNVNGVRGLAAIAQQHDLTLVHLSSDYVFDGTSVIHGEDEPPTPLGVYGQTKAAGDAIVSTVPKHYIVRTSWVIGDGANFVRTIMDLARRAISPTVVNDQVGRLTFTADLAVGILRLLDLRAPFGTYNLTSDGTPCSWAEIAREVYRLSGCDPAMIIETSTENYSAGRPVAPRPLNSTLDLRKSHAAHLLTTDQELALKNYVLEDATREIAPAQEGDAVNQARSAGCRANNVPGNGTDVTLSARAGSER